MRGDEYVDKGIAHHEEVRRERQLQALQRRARRMGFDLVEQAS